MRVSFPCLGVERERQFLTLALLIFRLGLCDVIIPYVNLK